MQPSSPGVRTTARGGSRRVVPESFLGSVCRASFLCGEFLREFVGVHGVLVRLLTELVSGPMVPFAVRGSGGGVGMGGKVVELGGSIVRALRHGVLSGNKRGAIDRCYSSDVFECKKENWHEASFPSSREGGRGIRLEIRKLRGSEDCTWPVRESEVPRSWSLPNCGRWPVRWPGGSARDPTSFFRGKTAAWPGEGQLGS